MQMYKPLLIKSPITIIFGGYLGSLMFMFFVTVSFTINLVFEITLLNPRLVFSMCYQSDVLFFKKDKTVDKLYHCDYH